MKIIFRDAKGQRRLVCARIAQDDSDSLTAVRIGRANHVFPHSFPVDSSNILTFTSCAIVLRAVGGVTPRCVAARATLVYGLMKSASSSDSARCCLSSFRRYFSRRPSR